MHGRRPMSSIGRLAARAAALALLTGTVAIAALATSVPSAEAGTTTETTIGLSSSPPTPRTGEAVTYTSTVEAGGLPVEEGSVAFYDDEAPVEGCEEQPVDAEGEATCEATAGEQGIHEVVAVYGDELGSYEPSEYFLLVTVEEALTTTTTTSTGTSSTSTSSSATTTTTTTSAQGPSQETYLDDFESSPEEPAEGEAVVYEATVFAESGEAAGGTVSFEDDGEVIPDCEARPVGEHGEVTCAALAGSSGVHVITLEYSDAGIYEPSVELAFIAVKASGSVETHEPELTFSSEPEDPEIGEEVTYRVKVDYGDTHPTHGVVTFEDFPDYISGCIGALINSNGEASCKTTATSAEPHSVGVDFRGSEAFAHAEATFTVSPPVTTTTETTTSSTTSASTPPPAHAAGVGGVGGSAPTARPALALLSSGTRPAISARGFPVSATCGPAACTVRAGGTVRLPGSSRLWHLGATIATIAAGRVQTLALQTPPGLRRVLRTYLRHHPAHRITVTVRLAMVQNGRALQTITRRLPIWTYTRSR